MDFLTLLLFYVVVALGVSWTTYLTIFLPASRLIREILEQETIYNGISGFFIWTIFASILAPWTLYIMLRNKNTEMIEYIAGSLATKLIENDDDE